MFYYTFDLEFGISSLPVEESYTITGCQEHIIYRKTLITNTLGTRMRTTPAPYIMIYKAV